MGYWWGCLQPCLLLAGPWHCLPLWCQQRSLLPASHPPVSPLGLQPSARDQPAQGQPPWPAPPHSLVCSHIKGNCCVLAALGASPPLAPSQCRFLSHGQSLQAHSSFGLGLKWHPEAKKPSSLVSLPHSALLGGCRNVPSSDTSHHL